MTWQPIKTAPRDGQYLLLCGPDLSVCVGAWFEAERDDWDCDLWFLVDPTDPTIPMQDYTGSDVVLRPTLWMNFPPHPDTACASSVQVAAWRKVPSTS